MIDSLLFQFCNFISYKLLHIKAMMKHTVNILLSPPALIYFKPFEGGGGGGGCLIEMDGLFEREAYLIWKRQEYQFSIKN